uniref:Uncharacterized protein n=1 Tax=Glossina brevipalpis TaxID=37001 RepID=A0A1A9WCX9_9MUSC
MLMHYNKLLAYVRTQRNILTSGMRVFFVGATITHCCVSVSTLCSMPKKAAVRCISIRLYDDAEGKRISPQLINKKYIHENICYRVRVHTSRNESRCIVTAINTAVHATTGSNSTTCTTGIKAICAIACKDQVEKMHPMLIVAISLNPVCAFWSYINLHFVH